MLKLMFGMLIAMACVAAQAQTPMEDASIALAKKAIANIKKNGIEPACKDFANPSGDFIQGELYVVVLDMHAKMICHATNPRMNGKETILIKDVDGKLYGEEYAQVAKTKGSGWVSFKFVNPVTKRVEPKASYIERVDDFIVSVGIYKK